MLAVLESNTGPTNVLLRKGISMEARKLDKLRETIQRSGNVQKEMLAHCLKVSQTTIKNKKFRMEVRG